MEISKDKLRNIIHWTLFAAKQYNLYDLDKLHEKVMENYKNNNFADEDIYFLEYYQNYMLENERYRNFNESKF